MSLPVASGGNGSLTYSISPSMGNGLSFDASARRITGRPTNAASTALYTYTATDADGDTAILRITVTVFDVSIKVEDENLKDVHWGVLAYSKARVSDPIHRTEDYRFRVGIPASTGFQLGRECTWPVEPPTSTATLWTKWVLLNAGTFDLVRCGLGSGGPVNISMRVRIQSESGPGSRFTITNVTIPQAWRRDDHQVDYYIRGSQPSSIQAITVGLFSSQKPCHLADHEISPELLSLTNYADAAQAWNDVTAGVTVNQMSSAGRADVVIRGYWDANPADGIDPECGVSIACTDPAGRYPHIGNQQTFWIEDPPPLGGRGHRKRVDH